VDREEREGSKSILIFERITRRTAPGPHIVFVFKGMSILIRSLPLVVNKTKHLKKDTFSHPSQPAGEARATATTSL